MRLPDRFPFADGALPGPGKLFALHENETALFTFGRPDRQMFPRLGDRSPNVLEMPGNLALRNADQRR